MKIAVLELLSGGGIQELIGPPLADQGPESKRAEVCQSLFREGWAMLHALASDLQQCGHQVLTCLDAILIHLDPDGHESSQPFDVRICNNRLEWFTCWLHAATEADITIVIAPEIDKILATTVSRLREHGVKVLAPDSCFLCASSDKLLFAAAMHDSKLLHPSTQTLQSFLQSTQSGKTISLGAIVLKRRDGAGCADMKRFKNDHSLWTWCLSNLSHAEHGEDWIVQPWLQGDARSLAVIAGRSNLILGAVAQRIQLLPSESDASHALVQYAGGFGPLGDVKMQHIEMFANRVLNAIPGTPAGWIGIDFLIPKGARDSVEWVPIEINPRLTTSYIGYREWYGASLGDMLLGIQSDSHSRDYSRFPSIDFR